MLRGSWGSVGLEQDSSVLCEQKAGRSWQQLSFHGILCFSRPKIQTLVDECPLLLEDVMLPAVVFSLPVLFSVHRHPATFSQ